MRKYVKALGGRVLLVGAGVLVLAGGVAYATIPDSGGVIHACYDGNGGDLRVIDAPSKSCTKFEISLRLEPERGCGSARRARSGRPGWTRGAGRAGRREGRHRRAGVEGRQG